MAAETIHTCSYQCDRPACIRAQRDELASRMTAETSNARGEVVAWVAEFPDGWKEFAADGEPEVTEWPTGRQPPSTIRPLAYADMERLSAPVDWRERLEALSSRYDPNSHVGAGIDAAIRELAAAPPPAAARGDVRGLVADRAAIKLLVAAGFVTEDKANEALRIAHGFDKGPLAPQPMQQGGGEVYWANGAQWPNVALPSAPVEVLAWLVMYGDRVTGWTDSASKDSVNLAEGERLVPVALAQQPASVDEACVWSLDTIDGSWDGACGAKWQFANGGPDDNDMRHCLRCGKRLATQHQEPTT